MAERKHRNIRELGQTMMLHAKIPKRYWVDCFTIVVYLINRLPSSVLNMDSPYSRLFGVQPDYSMLRVSGCRCSLYLGDNTKDKLDLRSLPSVFMGYSNKYKGYRCLYPPTGRINISRHVVFEECTLPYCKPASLYQHDQIEGDVTTFTD